MRYRDQRVFGLSQGLVYETAPLGITTLLNSEFTGGNISYERMPPSIGLEDYLYVAGEGYPSKVSPAWALSKWGIDPPTSPIRGSKSIRSEGQLDAFDGASGSRVVTFTPTGAAAASFSTPNKEGAASMKLQFDTANQKVSVLCTLAATENFTKFGTDDSPDDDLIQVWVRTNRPDAIEYFQIKFFTDSENYWQYDFLTSNFTAQERALFFSGYFERIIENGRVRVLTNSHDIEVLVESQGHVPPAKFSGRPQLAQDTEYADAPLLSEQFPLAVDTWVLLRVPRGRFFEVGTPDWAAITSYEILSKSNRRGVQDPEDAAIWIDDLRRVGGVGMEGTYRYCTTFHNSALDIHSNPKFIDRDEDGIVDDIDYLIIENVEREPILIEDIPVSTDPQVDKVEIWRTYGNGTTYYKAGEVDNGTTEFLDTVADSLGIYSGYSLQILGLDEIRLDNTPPSLNTFWVTEHTGRAWTLENTAGKYGRVNYSPKGRPESVEGFIEVTNDSDPCKGAVSWNGSLWVFTESKIFQVTGDETFTYRAVSGAPGTTHPYTLTVTPYGIAYHAHDGPRLFNGNTSTRLASEPVIASFRGLANTDFPAFGDSTVACYGRGEWWISDGARTLALRMDAGTWREIDVQATGLYYESDVDNFVVTEGEDGNGIFLVEVKDAVGHGGFDLDFDVETATMRLSPETQGIVRRIHVEANTGGELVTVVLLADGVEHTLGTMNTTERETTTFEIMVNAKQLSVRLTAALTVAAIEIFSIDVDLYHPTGEGSEN